jgi:acetoin utilization deacetylase AcuC-like enzyme
MEVYSRTASAGDEGFPYPQPQEVETEEDGDEGIQEGALPTHPVGRCLNCTADLYDEPCEECGHDPNMDDLLFDGSVPNGISTCVNEAFSEREVHCEVGTFKGPFVLAYDERMLLHSEECFENPGHPERPDRLRAIMARLQRSGLLNNCTMLPCREATSEELERCHTPALLSQIAAASQSAMSEDKNIIHLKPDTYVNAHTFMCARLSAGACVDVTLAVASGTANSGIAICRPPGHHAESNMAMGFCFYNNAAVAARAAQAVGVKRIMIFDWDVHHGNGTQHIFEDDPDVLYVSIHRYDHGDFYPGTGSPTAVGGRHEPLARGRCVNIGWPHGGMGDADYMAAMNHVILPITASFAPDLILLSAGFDAAEGDPIGGCRVSPQCYAHMAAALQAHAPTVALLEGGYNLEATAACTESTVRALLGQRPVGGAKLKTNLTSAGGMMAVSQAMRIQGEFWPTLGALRLAYDQISQYGTTGYHAPSYTQHVPHHLDNCEDYDNYEEYDDYEDYDDVEGEESEPMGGRATTIMPVLDDDVMTTKTFIP